MKPDLKFLFAHPAHFIALGFGSGLSPVAPGTAGTLAAWLLFPADQANFSDAGFLAFLLAAFVLGVFAAAAPAGPGRGRPRRDRLGRDRALLAGAADDAGGLPLAAGGLHLVPLLRHRQAAAGALDRRPHENGFGVMLDDLVAAGYTLLVLALFKVLFNGWRNWNGCRFASARPCSNAS
jgi:phosphatidylglycerophosphatase A